MYAIIKTGSKQYRVAPGDIICVELLDALPGQQVELRDVLCVSQDDGNVRVGFPTVPNCVVKAEYLADVQGPKITSVKYKQRKNQYRKFGHRQQLAQLKITDIQA